MGKRILFLANHFITLYSFRRELIQRLLEEGHEVWLSLPQNAQNSYFEDMGCKILPTEIDRRGVNPLKDLKLLRFYQKEIPKINPDIIFSYTIKPNIYGSIATNGKYRQICNITGTGATFLKPSAVSLICMELYRISVKHCYKVFFQNTGDKDFFRKHHMVGRNYALLPGSGCDLKEHRYSPMPPDDEIRFLFIGRVMRVKGIDEYLRAAKLVKAEFPNTKFYIAGWNEEPEYQAVVAKYQSEGAVEYIGFRKDIKDWITKCHCTVLPSHGGEGVPNALLESAATGRACIGSRIPGTEDVIENGANGFLFAPGNAQDLAWQMLRFLHLTREQRETMGRAGREKVEREFDREIVIEKYLDEIRNIP